MKKNRIILFIILVLTSSFLLKLLVNNLKANEIYNKDYNIVSYNFLNKRISYDNFNLDLFEVNYLENDNNDGNVSYLNDFLHNNSLKLASIIGNDNRLIVKDAKKCLI